MLGVANLRLDLYEFQPVFNSERFDFDVYTIYENPRQYTIVIKRLDESDGWGVPIKTLAYYTDTKQSVIYEIGPSQDSEKRVQITTDFEIYPLEDESCTQRLSNYSMVTNFPQPNKISRQDFNILFNTDLVILPTQLYAVGIKDRTVYIYTEKYALFNEIIRSINHIITAYFTFRDPNIPFYFLICSGDGYMEYHFPSERTIARKMQENECEGKDIVVLDNPEEYAVFDSRNTFVLAQSYQKGTPNALGIPDRHYFYCNLYQSFRSFHRGLPFDQKINRVAYVGRIDRGSKYNYTERRDIDMNPRHYFFSDAVPKMNIDCSKYWINSQDLVKYKYILDIDGMASTWDATAWKLNSGSVLFKTDSCWKQWFYEEFMPWIHYIPIKDDFSDLDEKFVWCEEHQPACEIIIQNAMDFFQKVYRHQNVVKYTLSIIDKLQN